MRVSIKMRLGCLLSVAYAKGAALTTSTVVLPRLRLGVSQDRPAAERGKKGGSPGCFQVLMEADQTKWNFLLLQDNEVRSAR